LADLRRYDMKYIDDIIFSVGLIALCVVGGIEGFLDGSQIIALVGIGGGFAYGKQAVKNGAI